MAGHVRPECLAVPLRDAEKSLKLLKHSGAIDARFRIKRIGGYLVIPVVDDENAARILREAAVEVIVDCMGGLEEAKGRDKWKPRIPYVVIGDIAVVNPVKGVDDIEYYRSAAREIIDNVKRIRSVWMKKRTSGLYRTPELIHLAGEARTETEAREYGLRFRLDIARVYYNPRLSYEHRSVAESISDGSIVLDMFSGIGGFSIHAAALREARILAVDINPYAAAYTAINVRINRKRLKGTVAVVAGDAARLPMVHEPVFDTIIMNHPTGAQRYADVACKMARRKARVLYYTLQLSKLEAADEAIRAFSGHCNRVDVAGVREVLDYSPDQRIYRVEVLIERRG